tara:strand:+ start:72 stop:176 length:105 start_codon:yes stop_codon:yes gene_type:complete
MFPNSDKLKEDHWPYEEESKIIKKKYFIKYIQVK